MGLAACVVLVASGCGTAGRNPGTAGIPASSQYRIRGELVEIQKMGYSNGVEGIIGGVLIEGARSSPVEEATLNITAGTRIDDRRSGQGEPTGFDALKVHQTVEADFVYVGKNQPVGTATSITICP